MNPPFFSAINVSGVHAVFGQNPVRVFPFGDAPEKATRPYAVFQTVGGAPEMYINQVPDSDDWLVQVDVYFDSEDPQRGIDTVSTGARVLRDALETVAYVVSWNGSGREGATKRYRYSFTVAFVTAR